MTELVVKKTEQVPEQASRHSQATEYPTYVIVGAGPVGIRCAQNILEHSINAQVVLIGAESEAPYNRVKLSQYLSDELSLEELSNPVEQSATPNWRLAEFHNRRVVSIDRKAKVIYDDSGTPQPYSKLILATGSRPARPPIPGADLANVICFRNLADTEALLSLRERCETVVVVGAGAVGLEAAAALKTSNNRVVLLARAGLLGGGLSEKAEESLKSALTALQIEVQCDTQIVSFNGDSAVESVTLSSGDNLATRAVVLCTGITPEISLAKQCGLDTGRGVRVSPYMQTSDPAIYAVGECAEIDQQIYQLVRPGFEQAKVCSAHICQEESSDLSISPYLGSRTDVELKISHVPCALIGETNAKSHNKTQVYCYENHFKGIYRELYVRNDRLVGTVIIGPWDEDLQVRQAVTRSEAVSPKALAIFEQEGLLSKGKAQKGIKQQPDNYLVCQCNGVTKGELCTAIANGKRTLEALEQETRAGSVCGSCRPIMAELLDTPAPNLVMRHARGILWASFVSLLLIAVATLLPSPPIGESVQVNWHLKSLWYDNFWKQVSGYTLLALCVFAGSLAIRKRLATLNLGHMDHWRYIHSILGVVALVVLVIHTGFRLGENLNLVLMLDFLAVTCTGALVGVFMARNHHWTDLKLRAHRKWWSRVHYALLWLLPVLLSYHILSVYYF